MRKIILSLCLIINVIICSCSSDSETTPNTTIEVTTSHSSESVTSNSFIVSGAIEGVEINDFTNGIATSGICWATTTNPTIDDFVETINIKYFDISVNSLTPNTLYYVRAYVEISGEIIYGNEIEIMTDDVEPILGANYMGGKIVYIYPSGHPKYVPNEVHGLIAAVNGQIQFSGTWGCQDVVCGQTSTLIGTGEANTTRIVNICGINTAAGLCYNLSYNGYNDWFLPSKDEMNAIYEYLPCWELSWSYITPTSGVIGANYVTSSEALANAMWTQPSDCNGYDNPTTVAKDYALGDLSAHFKILPIREF